METPLTKAERIIKTGGISVIAYLRKSKKHCTAVLWGVRNNVRKTTLQISRSEKKGSEVLQVLEQRIPCSPQRGAWWSRLSPCRPMEDPMLEQVDMPWRKLQSMESPHWKRLLAWTTAHGEEPMLEQFGRSCGLKGTQMGAVFRQDCKPCRGPVLELFLKSCSLWEGHMQEQFIKDCSFRERPTVKKGKRVRRKEWQRQAVTNSAIPIPHLLCHSGGEEEESGVKLSWEERGGWGNVLYVSLFLTVFPLLLLGNQLLIFPWSSCFCPWE